MRERNPFVAKCSACGHAWVAAILPMEMRKFAKLMKGIACPNCGEGNKEIFWADKETAQPVIEAFEKS